MKRLSWPVLFLVVAGCTPVVREYQELKEKNYNRYHASHKPPEYRGDSLKNIMFPVGGIGTGDVLLGGRGEIRSLEIFGRPAVVPDEGQVMFFALWLKEAGEFNSVEEVDFKPVSKILERRLTEGLGEPGGAVGPVPGLPRFREAVFTGTYPFARLGFDDPEVPVDVEAEVFNPLIPLDLENSSLPAAIFHWVLTSKLDKDIEVSLLFYMSDPFIGRAEPSKVGDFRGFTLTSGKEGGGNGRTGEFSVTGLPELQVKTGLSIGPAELQHIWEDFSMDGALQEEGQTATGEAGKGRAAACWVRKTLKPGDTLTLPFIMTWMVPYREVPGSASGAMMANRYATRFSGSVQVAENIIGNRDYLYGRTRQFTSALNGSSYPDYVVDALTAGMAALKTNLVSVDAKGRVRAYSGLLDDAVTGRVNSSQVWNHAQTMAWLFPQLERSLVEQTLNDGPDGPEASADGLPGSVIRLYRDWKLTGDTRWMAGLWPEARQCLEVPWDPDREGVLRGSQPTTFGNLEGANMMTGSIYLAALMAAEKMAAATGDDLGAGRYRDIRERGRKWYAAHLWNGEYFIQESRVGGPSRNRIGEGCLSGQLAGQFMADAGGLGCVVDSNLVVRALKSVYRYNFRSSLRDYEHTARAFAVNDEGGLLNCTWPHGHQSVSPFRQAGEVWTGIEYGVAASLIRHGLTDEGLAVVRTARDRYRGYNRNPWSEIETGRYSARSLSGWALLPALSGFSYDAEEGTMAFDPQVNAADFSTFWSCGTGWGIFRINARELEIRVLFGSLTIRQVRIPGRYPFRRLKSAEHAGMRLIRDEAGVGLLFEPELQLDAGSSIRAEFSGRADPGSDAK